MRNCMACNLKKQRLVPAMRIDVYYHWYKPSLTWLSLLLLPLSFIFGFIIIIRRLIYQRFAKHFPVPVVVVGNITVGGTGKTPFVIWLAQFLKQAGFKPGIVSRGVGGKRQHLPYHVKPNSPVTDVGDEALLLAKTGCPLVLAVDRAAAVASLLKQHDCDIVISDDGLQHYHLGRDVEIAIVDGKRALGNRYLLPAGPLREPASRLNTVDLVIVNNEMGQENALSMQLLPTALISISNQHKIPLNGLGNHSIHAVAGIGHPQKFFASLERAGYHLIPHIFPDHYLYQASDLDFADGLPIVMTEKDAVKCSSFADARYWYVETNVLVSSGVEEKMMQRFIHSPPTSHL
jgi:tetraacyldisaccharide 4'-kinase